MCVLLQKSQREYQDMINGMVVDHQNVKPVLRRFTGKHAKYGPVYVPVDERKSKPR